MGALGPVFRTYEPDRDRLVAVKVFRLDITPEQAQALADELSRAAEAGLFHPSIVEPIAAGVQGSVAYNAEEYVAAESLDIAIRHYAPAQIDTVLPFITQLAGAIDFARAAGVGHGALHPRDIFMTPDEARATGFGVVEALERVGLRAPVRRPYTSPERIAGASWSTEADVFSLAAITYELLTGRRPAGLGGEIGPLNPGAGSLHAILVRAMDANPARRYPTALSFVSALEAAARDVPDTPAAATARPGPERDGVTPVAAAAPIAAPPAISGQPTARDTSLGRTAGDEVEEEDEDIFGEKDEDEAHHRLMLQEKEQAAARESIIEREIEPEMDEDSEVEAEADRYAGDDFLLDAAGAASAPDLSSVDSFRASDEPVDLRALDDDEVMVDEPPSPLFQPEDLLQTPEAAAPRPASRIEAPRPAPVASAPSFGHYASPIEDAEESPGRSRWGLGLVLLFGLLLGFAGGYAVWGRSTPPAAREYSEQTVAQTPATGTTPAPSSTTPRSDPARDTPPAATAPTSRETGARAPAPGRSGEPSGSASGPRSSAPGAAGSAAAPAGAATAPKPAPAATRGTLVVRSTPNGAGVTVNGRWRGRTPLTLEQLPFARYDVRIVQPGYVAAREGITLSAGEPARSVSVKLEQASRGRAAAERRPPAPTAEPERAARPERYTGSVYVDSRPRGARVFIDGKPVGTTPLSVAEIPIGSHVVRLELPDHRIWSTTARVSSGQQVRVTGSLEPIQ